MKQLTSYLFDGAIRDELGGVGCLNSCKIDRCAIFSLGKAFVLEHFQVSHHIRDTAEEPLPR